MKVQLRHSTRREREQKLVRTWLSISLMFLAMDVTSCSQPTRSVYSTQYSWLNLLHRKQKYAFDMEQRIIIETVSKAYCLQCFDTVGWAAGRASGLQKTWVVQCWQGYLSGARCRLAYGPVDTTAAHCLLLQQNPNWFYLSGTGSPG